MPSLLVHSIFDLLAWLTALGLVLVLRRRFPSAVEPRLRAAYAGMALIGAGVGAWLFGSLNLLISGLPMPGRSIEGAIVGAVATIEIWKRVMGIGARTGAVYALPLCAGIAVGRIGCLLSGIEDNTHGIPTGAAWGWDFGDGIPRHPVQLYESLAMVLFGLVYAAMLLRNNVWWKANGFHLVVGFYASQRFVLEFWKPYGSLVADLTLFQLLSLLLLLYAAAMLASSEHR